MATGAAAFATEVLAPELPNTGLDKESKQCCPLCHEEKKLKELRGHIGLHILWCLLGVDERLEGGKVSVRPLQIIPNTNPRTRLGIILADSAVATSATPTS